MDLELLRDSIDTKSHETAEWFYNIYSTVILNGVLGIPLENNKKLEQNELLFDGKNSEK